MTEQQSWVCVAAPDRYGTDDVSRRPRTTARKEG